MAYFDAEKLEDNSYKTSKGILEVDIQSLIQHLNENNRHLAIMK